METHKIMSKIKLTVKPTKTPNPAESARATLFKMNEMTITMNPSSPKPPDTK
jgi:hypothetical protein